MSTSAFAAMRIAPVAASTSPRNAAPPPQSCQPMTTPLMTTTRRAARIGIIARASADDDGPKASPSRRVARRAPKTKTTEEGGGGATSGAAAARGKTTKTTKTTTRTRKVRKLSSEVKEAAASSSRQVISVERREREALALKKFTEAKASVLKGASTLEGLVRGGGGPAPAAAPRRCRTGSPTTRSTVCSCGRCTATCRSRNSSVPSLRSAATMPMRPKSCLPPISPKPA